MSNCDYGVAIATDLRHLVDKVHFKFCMFDSREASWAFSSIFTAFTQFVSQTENNNPCVFVYIFQGSNSNVSASVRGFSTVKVPFV